MRFRMNGYQAGGRELKKYYFAYGANTNLSAMASRCPASICIGKVVLNGFRLVFRSEADIEEGGNGILHGALWTITPECEAALDIFEGYPRYYTKRTVVVAHGELGEVEAMVYTMTRRTSQEPPRRGYRDLIAQGYADFDIPSEQLHQAVRQAERQYRREIREIREAEYQFTDG